jgi:chaperonin cofactor prefoldin
MFGEFPLITVFFRIVNAAVLVGLIYFLYRRFFKFRIEEKINQKEALVKGLEEQGYALEGRVGSLQRQVQWQQERADTIKSKIDEWRTAVTTADKRRTQELAQYAQRAAERVEIKNTTIAQDQWKHSVMPKALENAQKELEKKFGQEAQNNAYLAQQIKKLAELS